MDKGVLYVSYDCELLVQMVILIIILEFGVVGNIVWMYLGGFDMYYCVWEQWFEWLDELCCCWGNFVSSVFRCGCIVGGLGSVL